MKQMNNEIIYPRSEEEVLLILATAKKEGHLLEIIFDEFVKKPFSMPVLWGCRAYFYGLKKEELSAHPVLFTHLALLSAMDGDLSQAKAYVQFMGKTPRLVKMDTYDMMDICRIKTELCHTLNGSALALPRDGSYAFSMQTKYTEWFSRLYKIWQISEKKQGRDNRSRMPIIWWKCWTESV